MRWGARVLGGAMLAASLVALGIPAHAGSNTGTLAPTMTIAKACIATGGTVAFPEYRPGSTVAVTASGSGATLQCTNTDAWSITAAGGNNASHATGTCGSSTCTRAMTDGSGHYIGYDLFVGACCSGTTVWNTTNKITGTGDGTVQDVTFWGEVAPLQSVPAGTYTDTVVATYTY